MKNIVTIGGGTGSFTVLSGLKKYPAHLSAIVSMADDGGSTGVLRDELGVLPPGDARQCLVALSDASESVRKLLNYRFESGGLEGHSFGNILLSALEKTMGSLDKGIKEASMIFNVRGEIIPVTEENIRLCLETEDGQELNGEHQIDTFRHHEAVKVKRIFLEPAPKANKRAIKAIKEAHLIVIGPGDIYSSILPNLLVGGIVEALEKTRARIVYVCNLMTKKPLTENFDLLDFVDLIQDYLGKRKLDFVIYNTQKPDIELVKKYAREGEPVSFNKKILEGKNYKAIGANLLSNKIFKQEKSDKLDRTLIRHDIDKLAKVLMKIL